MELKEFLYLDAALLDQYMAQVEGGLVDEQRERDTTTADGGMGVGDSTGLFASGRSRTTGTSAETERVRRETSESKYNRLHDVLDLIELDSASTSTFGRLLPRKMVSAACYVDVPSLSRALGMADDFSALGPLLKAFAPTLANDEEMDTALAGLSQMNELSEGAIVATGELSPGETILAFKLSRTGLKVRLDELEGEAVVVGRIHSRVAEGQRLSLLTVPGLNLLNREARRELERNLEASPDDETSVPGPAVSLSVLAIFR